MDAGTHLARRQCPHDLLTKCRGCVNMQNETTGDLVKEASVSQGLRQHWLDIKGEHDSVASGFAERTHH